MPSRWLVPIHGIDPTRIDPNWLHGAVSNWFDQSSDAHHSGNKPWAMSLLGASLAGSPSQPNLQPAWAIEVSVLTDDAHRRLMAATAPGKMIRLGTQHRTLGRPQLLHRHDWRTLAQPTGANEWELNFVTPVTFRTGNRSSPLATPSAVLHRLEENWSRWSGMPARQLPRERAEAVWVSGIDGRSKEVEIGRLKEQHDRPQRPSVSAFMGQVTYRCDEPNIAAVIDPLLRLAAYAGVGSYTTMGLGVTRVATVASRRGSTTGEQRHPVASAPTHGTRP
jgi:CRISPR-associated endoribonuclease Cas6